jgi:aryl-alcohol dehydrogenase-like predicted oxidoreductase
MEYRRLGCTGLKVSELCLGTGVFSAPLDEAASHRILSAAIAGGINFIDTADVYSSWAAYAGSSEEIIGRWLKNQPRDQLIIATKVRGKMGEGPNDEGLSRVHIMRAAEASLRRLQTDYIDLYQCHWPDDTTPLDETLRALDDLVHQGKVRYIGCSNYPAWQLCKALWISDKNGLARFDSLQPHYNLIHRAEFERELMPLCQDQGLGVIAYSPLAGGFLTGKYRKGQPIPPNSRGAKNQQIQKWMNDDMKMALLDKLDEIGKARGKTTAQVALGWLLTNPVITAPIFAATGPEQLQEVLGAAGLRLTPEEKKALDDLTAWS